MNCPKCGRGLVGNPRSCGYCGASIVSSYFSRPPERPADTEPPHIGTGATAAMALGVFGSIGLIAGLAFHVAALFGFGVMPEIGVAWWVRTLLMVLFPVVYLVQIASMRGLRFSLVFDCLWLFLSACGLSLTVQEYLARGNAAFSGIAAIPYLLTLGCSLVLVASGTAILSYQKPV